MIELVEQLFENQIRTWPRLARGLEGLARAQTRPVRIGWFDVLIRYIPHRAGSTTAAVDPVSIARRPCFLCTENLDPEERGIAFGADYTIYCNPFPIVDRHLTIVHHEHKPQRIGGEIGTMLDIAEALPTYFVVYNGPQCGASAPDHLHFQAGSRTLFPIEKDTAEMPAGLVPGYARNVLLLRGADRTRLIGTASRAIELLSEATGRRPEPLINIAAFRSGSEWTMYLFPRGKHRPAVYYTGELIVSPASVDLCGIFVTPFEKDYSRISAGEVAAIFKEITLSERCRGGLAKCDRTAERFLRSGVRYGLSKPCAEEAHSGTASRFA